MLFDLSSPGRKNVVRVVFGFLALIFAVGFIGFGIGGEIGGGGIVDSITGGGGSDTADQYEQQIEDAESTLETDPENQRALANLAQYRYLSGQAQLEIDEATGQPTLTEESRGEFEKAIDAFTRYLDTKPEKPDVGSAGQVVQAYVFLGDAEGAARAQQILADANPSAGTYSTLAYYLFADLNFKAAEKAVERALAEAKPGERKSIEKQLDQLRKAAEKQKKQAAQLPESATGGGTGIEDPFGGLAPDAGGAVPPAAP